MQVVAKRLKTALFDTVSISNNSPGLDIGLLKPIRIEKLGNFAFRGRELFYGGGDILFVKNRLEIDIFLKKVPPGGVIYKFIN